MPGCPTLPSICTHTGRVTHVGRSGADSSTTQKCGTGRCRPSAAPALTVHSVPGRPSACPLPAWNHVARVSLHSAPPGDCICRGGRVAASPSEFQSPVELINHRILEANADKRGVCFCCCSYQ